ncbi:DsbA family protein [Flexivirga alba]|uniref:DsbA family protein n=1 Tax=Flexivirga alba TaxID=702742 RepID=A0ABW2AAJ3_9MICO
MNLVIYADFSGPECYLASRRADAIAAAAAVDWRAVEQYPRRPVSGVPVSESEQLPARLAALEQLLLPREQLPWRLPTVVPKTQAAVSAYAEAHGTRVDAEVRRLLFDLYWRDGADIGSPTVLRTPLTGPMLRSGADADPLRQFGYAVGPHREPITTGAHRRIQAWRGQWQQLGGAELPVVLVDGATLTGLDAVRRLGKEIARLGVDVAPVLADPLRYPALDGNPPLSWVSQIGGEWLHRYRIGAPS